MVFLLHKIETKKWNPYKFTLFILHVEHNKANLLRLL